MKEIIDKLTSYNIFNYLLPGVLFVQIAEKISAYEFQQHELLVDLFIYYFAGLIISRFGSLLIEPLLKGLGLIKLESYKNFLEASCLDAKLEILSEANNTYRTLIALPFALIIVLGWASLEQRIGLNTVWKQIMLLGILMLLLVYSYRKQTDYISKRVKHLMGSK